MATQSPTNSPYFDIRPVPGKGLGTIALMTIQPGTIILTESPLMTVMMGEISNIEIGKKVFRLSRDDQTLFFSLANSQPEHGPVIGIWNTNSQQCGGRIETGEEITSGYGELCDTRTNRKAHLSSWFRFTCHCEDEVNAKAWAKLAAEMAALEYGAESEKAKQLKKTF
ncbi:SET domain superfamily protein [Pseudohyphozyma bogoriensis]|nr:SET domain superfamily protein [Pseudohyphozyma bogoriensis]